MNNQLSQTFITNIGDLLEVQRASFYRFLLYGITKELNSVLINPFFLLPIETTVFPQLFSENEVKNIEKLSILQKKKVVKKNSHLKKESKKEEIFENSSDQKPHGSELSTTLLTDIYLYPSKVKIKGPVKSLHTCFEREETYSTSIYIQGELVQRAPTTSLNSTKDFFIPKISTKKDPFQKKRGVKNLKISSQFTKFQNSHISIKKYFYLTTIPFLTEDGTFYVNGCERVVVNQIVRSPGIYFRREYLSFQKPSYTATFISDNWLWTKITLDNTLSYVTKVNKLIELNLEKESQNTYETLEKEVAEIPRKYDVFISLTDSNFWRALPVSKETKDGSNELLLIDLILHLGFTLEEIFDGLKYPDKLAIPDFLTHSSVLNTLRIENLQKKEPSFTSSLFENEIKDVEIEDTENSEASSSGMERILEHIMSENDEKIYFSLGELGRYRLNKRLGLNLPLSTKSLTALDFLKIIDNLIQLREENLLSDDIDDLKNKQIRGVGDLVRNQLRLGIFRSLKHPKFSEENFIASQVNSSNGLSKLQKKNDINAISWSTNSFDLLSYLRNAVDRSMREFFLTSQLSQYFDETNPLAELAHKRKISVFGPDGLQREKISTKIRDIHPSQYGKICPVETPEGENAGLVMSLASFARVNQYGWIESPYFLVEKGSLLRKTKIFYLNPHQEQEFKLAFANNTINENGKILASSVSIKDGLYFSETEPTNVDFSALSPLQILSIGTILVPFVEHNDANRALMGSNMQRQAVPLFFIDPPFVGTGFESNVSLESGLTIKSETEGIVDFVSSVILEIRDENNQKLVYKLTKYRRSNQETTNNQRCFFWPGEKVYSGQVIVDSSASSNGELSLGTNLLIGYLPWEGYNYEDAIVINESLVTQNLLTSLHISTYQTSVKPTRIVLKKINYLLKASRKIRFFKNTFRKLKEFESLHFKKNSFHTSFKKLSKEIIKSKNLLTERFTDMYYVPEYLLGKEKVSAYVGKSTNYLTRHLSSNGIVKIGSYIKGGDFLVSKLQIIDGSRPKSSYQKLFEDLQPSSFSKELKKKKQNKKTKFPKKIDFYKFKKEKKKLQKALTYLKFLNTKHFKLLILLKRVKKIEGILNKFLNYPSGKILKQKDKIYFKSLQIKYKTRLHYLLNLSEQIRLERRKQYLVGSYLLRIVKLLSKNFYKKLYKNFYIKMFRKKRLTSIVFKNFKEKLLKTNLKASSFLLTKIYFKLKNQALKTIKTLYSVSLEDPLFEENRVEYSINLLAKISPKALENFSFNNRNLTKTAEHFFFLQLEMIHRLCKQRKSFYRKNKLKLPQSISYKDTSFIFPLGSQGKVIDVKIMPLSAEKDEISLFITGFVVKIYVLEMRKIQIGDKLSGRHGNKGVISRILPTKDMPILPDGRPLDILVNPLGVPSRMNVGQLLECLLGLSAMYLGKRFKVRPFDEVFGVEASRVFVTQKLKEASLVSKTDWLYNEDSPGKFYLRDGRTGEFFDNPVTVGVAYILKLIHLVEDKIHSRALGPYNRVTEQPLQGKSSNGGQRFGEMEVWALEAHGCANTLQELLTVKSDDIDGRNDLYKTISSGEYYEKPNPSFSETLVSLIREMNALGLDFQFFKNSLNSKTIFNSSNLANSSKQEIKIFTLLEERLKLRFKSEELKFRYSDFQKKNKENELINSEKFQEQEKLLFNFLGKF